MSQLAPRRPPHVTLAVAGVILAASTHAFADRQWQVVGRLSVAADGTQANDESLAPIVSPNGRFVAFSSRADNLVPGDTNGERDAFVVDRWTGQVTRVSVASDGTQGNGDSVASGLSRDGRFVLVSSAASNLVPGDVNERDVFVHDCQTGQTTRVSVASDGTPGNGLSTAGSLTPDGRFASFQSAATNLVPGDTNGVRDIFVHDRQTGQTTRVSVASDGTQGNGHSISSSLSADGRFVAFSSQASTLVPGDTNDSEDIFLHDRQAGQTTRVSVASDGSQADGRSGFGLGVISADGRFIVFPSVAGNLVEGDTNGAWDVFLHDQLTGRTTRVNLASDGTASAGDPSGTLFPFPSISPDGRFVLFQSGAGDLVEGDTNGISDLFVHDRHTGRTDRVSVAADGTQGDGPSQLGSISRGGRIVAVTSFADNLVAGDTNGVRDIFVAKRRHSDAEALSELLDTVRDQTRPTRRAGPW